MPTRTIDEAARLQLLADYGIMDTAPDEALDEIVAMAAAICETPIALVSLVDDTRQWFKARVGLDAQQTPRDIAFCAHVVADDQDGLFVVNDAREDTRFVSNPLVTGDPKVVFYAGAPLAVEEGARLGTLCVIDRKPRKLTEAQERSLATLSKVVVRHLQHRREAMEQAATKARLEAVLSSIGEGVIATDAQARVVFANGVAAALSPVRDVEGKPFDEVLPLYAAASRQPIINVADLTLSENRVITLEAMVLRPDGSDLPVEVRSSPIRVGDRVTGTVLIVRDIGERRLAEIEREKMLRGVVDNLPELAWSARANGYIDFYNERWYRYTGTTPEEMEGWGWQKVHDPAMLPRVLDAWATSIATGEPFELEFPIRAADGSYRWFLTRARPLRDSNGMIVRWVGMNADIDTQRTAMKSAEEANRAKDEFLATASHELRTPLNAILGWAQLLRSGRLDPSATVRGIDTIERNAKVQVTLINDILDGSRIITGKLHLEVRPLDMTVLVNAALEAVRPAAEAKGIILTLAMDPAAARITGDSDRLQQIVWNLANNAIKFTPRGGAIGVHLVRSGTHIELSVTDSGQGIHADFLPHVFERFRQAEGSAARRHGGLGLGLALVRHLVEAHGGTVHAYSEGTGRGARFAVLLPVQAVYQAPVENIPHDPSPVSASVYRAETENLAEITVLVIDDENDARDLVATVLRSNGANVLSATSAANALEILVDRTPTLIISDIGMPTLDGYELMRRVRALENAAKRNIPAIALTAYSRDVDRHRALEAGFQNHVTKPVEPAELLRVVRALVSR